MSTPTLFVSHGAPSLVLEDGPSRDFLTTLGRTLGEPRAIVCVSAHWTTPDVMLGLSDRPEMIYDFRGLRGSCTRCAIRHPGSRRWANV